MATGIKDVLGKTLFEYSKGVYVQKLPDIRHVKEGIAAPFIGGSRKAQKELNSICRSWPIRRPSNRVSSQGIFCADKKAAERRRCGAVGIEIIETIDNFYSTFATL